MRLLITLRRLGTGGIEQASLTLANAMAAAGHEVHLLVLKGQPTHTPHPDVIVHCRDLDREQRSGLAGMGWHLLSRLVLAPLLPHSRFVWQGWRCSRAFDAFVADTERRYGPLDLILLRGQGAFEMLWRVQDPRAWRVVEAVTGRFSRNAWGRWLTRRLFQGKRVVCVSEGVRTSLHAYLTEQRVTLDATRVIYNAVPIAELRHKAQEAPSPVIPGPFLVHVARLVPVKQQTLLLEAFALARRQGLTHRLVIIGDGSQRPKLEALTQRLGLEEVVHFLGQQANPYPWVARADALVLSSRFEGLGIVLIEALALGTPCVATQASGGIAEVLIDEQRDLVTEPTAAALAEGMLKAVTSPITIRPAWVERFAEPRIVGEFLDLIEHRSESADVPSS
ncbi:glycosyltransferase [Halomonas caseinilytica]|uniref:glycosyltransferase n=1 Tax=Halomonas caseinilytica TaxID=438744 RepID=UPI0007E54A4D|nr:glycosyltransferase [Halomonas caseinilytica]SEM37583.1 Glycosyltransferase involved in cell wall bisynthesis [Halomonas caseinilytica]